MPGPLQFEQERLMVQAIEHARAERRSVSFGAQLVVVNVAFALAPLVPGASSIFGSITVWQGFGFTAVPLLMVAVSALLYRRLPNGHWLYRWSEGLEIFLLYSNQLAFIFAGGLRWSPLWALCPFAAAVFASTQPFAQRFYLGVFALSHGAMAGAALLWGREGDAVVALGFGGLSAAAYAFISRFERTAVLAVADRNFALVQLSEHRVAHERTLISNRLAENVSQRLTSLVTAMQATRAASLEPSIAQATSALRETELIVASSRDAGLPKTIDALAATLEQKIAPLCAHVKWAVERNDETGGVLEPAVALALLRIGQELVRNAVTHGAPQALSLLLTRAEAEVTLTVRDDGAGLQPERFNRSTGGLRNARRWAEEQGGTFQRLEQHPGSALRVVLPG